MGRGSSGTKTGNSVTHLIGTDNKPIDLSGSPLIYGADDKNLTSAERTQIEAFEKKRVSNKIEFVRFVDANGKIIEENKGGRGSVHSSRWAHNNASVMTHNHPRGEGVIGGTFSTQDISNFADYAMRTSRAAAAEGTYSITKTSSFDGSGLKQYYSQEKQAALNTKAKEISMAEANYNAAWKAYLNNTGSYAEVEKAYREFKPEQTKANNKYLVTLHNALISGQKKYGYTYTLERRK